MAKIDITKVWALNYRLVKSVIGEVPPALQQLGLEVKELFLLAELDAHPYPAALAEAFGQRLGRLTANEQAELKSLLEKLT